MSICHYCREQEAYLSCSCSNTPMKLCFPCFQQHHSGVEKDGSATNCQVCSAAEVDVVCSCQFPPLRMCKSCGNTHVLSSGSIWHHNLESVAVSRGKNLDDQQYVINLVFKNLQEDLSLVQRAVAEVNAAADAAAAKIDSWRKSKLQHLCEVQDRVSAQIGLIKAQIDAKLSGRDIQIVTKLDQVIQNGEKYLMADTLKELSMFKYRFDSSAFERLIDQLFSFEEDYSLASLERFAPAATKIEMLHVVTGTNAMLKYELPAGYMQMIRITRVSKFLPGTAWCYTSSGAIVFTGGEKGGDVIKESVVVNPVSKTAARLKDMCTARAYHGQIFYLGSIFVFGGTSNVGFWTGKPDGLTSCEKYSPDTCEWTVLPDLIEARAVVSAVLWMDLIYVAGTGSARVEAFNPLRSEMALLPYVIPGAKKYRLLILPFENDLLILKRNRLYRIKLSNRSEDVLELQQYDKPILDQENPQPAQLFDTFFVQTTKATFLLNAKTYQLEKAFKFPELS